MIDPLDQGSDCFWHPLHRTIWTTGLVTQLGDKTSLPAIRYITMDEASLCMCEWVGHTYDPRAATLALKESQDGVPFVSHRFNTNATVVTHTKNARRRIGTPDHEALTILFGDLRGEGFWLARALRPRQCPAVVHETNYGVIIRTILSEN